MCLKEQHPTELQSRNPGPRSNKTNGISSMHPRSRVSFVVFMSCTFTIFAWYSHGLDGSTICICCFSIFSTPHLFALFDASPGYKLYLQLFYLYYPPPICVLYHPYWVRTCVELHVLPFTLRNPAAYLHGFRLQFGYSRFCKESTGLQRHETTKKRKRRSSIQPRSRA